MDMEEGSKAPQLTEAEKRRNSQAMKKAFLLGGGAIAFLAIAGGLCLSGTINLAGETTSLPDFQSRIQFALKYQTLPLLWILVLIINVILGRVQTGAVNPLDGRDTYLKAKSNVLQNTFEQFILSAFAQLILVSFIDETYTFRAIPMVNFLFFIGRVAFWAGYPSYRSFGLFLGFIPTTGMIGVCVYKFFEHLF